MLDLANHRYSNTSVHTRRRAIERELITVAGWREITNSPLPCIGFQPVVYGFTPFTGRRTTLSISAPIPLPLIEGDHPFQQQEEQQQQQQQQQQQLVSRPRPIPHHSRPCHGLPTQDFESVTSRLHSFLKRLHEQDLHLNAENVDNSKEIDNNASPRNSIFSIDIEDNIQSKVFNSVPEEDFPKMAYFTNNSPPISPSILPSSASVSSSSIFSISPQDAACMVKTQRKNDDCRSCYLIHAKLRPLFSDDVIPGACLRKLPRLINGIPLGAGFLSRDQLTGIKWRLIEGGHSTLTFISCPMEKEEAEESKTGLKDRLVKLAQIVFGDMIIKVNIILTKCIDYEDDFVINDIAVNLEEGLHFRD